MVMRVGYWSRSPGIISTATWWARWSVTVGISPPQWRGPGGGLGNRRLNKRWMQFKKRKKPNNVANAAIARELAGWCWSLAVLEE